MSDDPKRTPNFFNTLKEHGISKQSLNSLMETVSKSSKPTLFVGFGLLANVAYGMYGIYNHQKSHTRSLDTGVEFTGVKPVDLVETDKNVLHLNKLVERQAWISYYANKKDSQNDKQPQLKLDWSGVNFKADDVYSEEKKNLVSMGNHLVYEAVIQNSTFHEMKIFINKEMDTRSFYKYSVEKGFTNNTNTELFMLPIDEHVKSKLGLNNTFSLQSLSCNTVEKSQKWKIEETFTIPQESKATISLRVKEKHKQYDFKTWVAVMGNVVATFSDDKENKIHTCGFKMQDLISEKIDENRRKNDNGTHKMLFCGLCEFGDGLQSHLEMEAKGI